MEIFWVPYDELLAAVLDGSLGDAPLVDRGAAGRRRAGVWHGSARPGGSLASSPQGCGGASRKECRQVKVGVPKEVKNHEYRVAITPIGVHELVAHGHEVVIETRAPASAPRSTTTSTSRAGAEILDAADDVWGTRGHGAQGQGAGGRGVPPDAGGPDPLHLPPPRRRQAARPRSCWPARSPRSPTRPCSCPPAGCRCSTRCPRSPAAWRPRSAPTRMLKAQGGRGVLMGGVGGVANAKVVIIGAGVSGQNAANIALGMGADVTLLDTDLDKLRMSFWRYNNRVHGLASSQLAIEQQVREADMVIGAVLIPGAKAPKLVSQRAGLADEAGLGAGRHRRRPGRLLRGHPPDHARRPDVHGARLDLLLRGEHARRGAEHLDVRPDQRDHAVRRGAGQQGLGSRPAATTAASRWASTPTPARSPTRPSARPSASTRSRWTTRAGAEARRASRPPGARRRPTAPRGRPHLPRPPLGRARAGGEHADVVPARPAPLPAVPRPEPGIDDLDEVTEATVSGVPGAAARGRRRPPAAELDVGGAHGGRGARASTSSRSATGSPPPTRRRR